MIVNTHANDKKDITQHEIIALQSRHNLADAHTHQNQSASQRDIVGMLPDIWYKSQDITQKESEEIFINEFFSLHKQNSVLSRVEDVYIVYAASIAMHITATYLAKKNMSVALVEPCFDNLHDLMKHMQVKLSPIPESSLSNVNEIYANLDHFSNDSEAVFFVDPNNPTGFSFFYNNDELFKEVIRFCVDKKKLLVLDFCFASFILANGYTRPDVYSILDESGVSYIAMEDTGKTWPLQDSKCATLICSSDIRSEIYPIYTSVLLNVSPFILNLVSEYVKDSKRDGFSSVKNVLSENLECLKETISDLDMELQKSLINTSVAWLKIGSSLPNASELQVLLERNQVYVLPGTFFYWNTPSKGELYIRIALARDPSEFKLAMIEMKNTISKVTNQ